MPSIASQLQTIPSIDESTSDLAGPPPGEILTHDVNRLLQYLHEVDAARNEQNLDMASHLERIEAMLRNLAVSLKEKSDRPPPVPTKDVSIGRSTVTRTPTPIPPQGSTRGAVASVRSLSPPPERLPSPSSLLTSISWLSSHHSDDWELMSTEDARRLSPSPSTTSSTTTEPPSEESAPQALPLPSSAAPVPPVSPALSVETVRPSLNLTDLREMIDRVLSEISVLRSGQNATQNMLKDIRRETTEEPHGETSEQRNCKAMIKDTEKKLEQILQRLTSEVGSSTYSGYSEEQDRSGLVELIRGLLRPVPPPPSLPMHAPSPVPPPPSMSDLFPDIGVPSAPSFPIHLEPLPTIQRPRTRLRHRSVTPPIIVVRPSTAPPPSSDGEYRRPFIPPESSSAGLPPILRPPRRQPPLSSPIESVLPDIPTRATSSGLPHMDEVVLDDRWRRRGDAPDGVFIPAGRPTQRPAVSVSSWFGSCFILLIFHIASASRGTPSVAQRAP